MSVSAKVLEEKMSVLASIVTIVGSVTATALEVAGTAAGWSMSRKINADNRLRAFRAVCNANINVANGR